MFVVVYNPETNEQYYSRRMGPREIMDHYKFAKLVADMYDQTLAVADGYIPSCSGDLRVEFRPEKRNDRVIWSGENYYFEREW